MLYRKLYTTLVVAVLLVCTTTVAQNNTPQLQNKPAAVSPEPYPVVYTIGIPVNYVRTWQPLKPYTNEADVTSAGRGVEEVGRVTQYLDGLGRPLQTVNWRTSPDLKDVIAPVVYDEFGREQFKYLPYTSTENNGLLKNNPLFYQEQFYNGRYKDEQPAFQGESVFYGQVNYEASPLNRVDKTMAAGNSWAGSGNGVQQQYLVNTGSTGDAVRIWDIGFSNNLQSSDIIPVNTLGKVYVAGELYKNVTVDEAQHKTVEYKNKEGKVILKKVQIAAVPSGSHEGWLCTYYVYDDLNQLRFVIPPKAVEALSGAGWNLSAVAGLVDGLCFRYEYDEKQRMIAKKIPGSGWVQMAYDNRDRLVFTQDANMALPTKKWWLMNIYDDLNRPVQTAMLTGYAGSRADLAAFLKLQAPGNTTLTTTGSYGGAVSQNLYVNMWQQGIDYRAGNSIVFQSDFESGNNAEFIAEITNLAPGSFTSPQQVNGYAIPGGMLIPLTYTFYDHYGWVANKDYNAANNNKLGVGANVYGDPLPAQKSLFTTGMVTGTRVRVIEDEADLSKGAWLETVSFYDDKGRVIQVASDNYKGGQDILTNRYDFSGKVISSYQVHNNAGAGIANHRVYTEIDFDHAGRTTEIRKVLNDDPATLRVITHNSYDALGQLRKKELGKKAGSSFLETQDYTYNIRGWLKGVNWEDYGAVDKNKTKAIADRWFAMDLSYDWGYTTNLLNGNIAGMRWQSKGDQQERSYGFSYDAASRLLSGEFKQFENNGWVTNTAIDFSMRMGSGVANVADAYDANGNILMMAHKGMKGIGTSVWIDELKYTYESSVGSNRLKNVVDKNNDPNTSLGDFRTSANHPQFTIKSSYATENADQSGVVDYTYDDNGNMLKDLNKEISAIKYSYLNLPYQITVNNGAAEKGTITYIYDASGNKLEKRVWEKESPANNNVSKNTVTSYAAGYVYENQVLQFLGQEEGRIRPLRNNETNVVNGYVFDYFLKDHLGNIRTTITDETGVSHNYVASMEDAARDIENDLFNKVPETAENKVPGFDQIAANQKVSKLFGTSGAGGQDKRVGPGIVLKVMKGDKFQANVKAWYMPGTSHEADNGLTGIVTSIASAFVGGVPTEGMHGVAGQALQTSMQTPLGDFRSVFNPEPLSRPNGTKTPKAYLNWILLDDQQLKMVNNSSGAAIVPDITGERVVLQANNGDDIEVVKNGYLYVYVSNESKGNVYFDDLTVIHTPGALLEETHYYPFGLTMAGITSKAAGKLQNKIRYNGKEEQRQEFSDKSGLEWIDYGARMYDNQVGRWGRPDPLSEKYLFASPYHFSANNPVLYYDADGNVIVNSNNPEVVRIKGLMYQTATGKSVWDAMVKSHRNIEFAFHYSTGTKKDVMGRYIRNLSAKALTLTKDEYNRITSGNNLLSDEEMLGKYYKFNSKTGDYDKTSYWNNTVIALDMTQVFESGMQDMQREKVNLSIGMDFALVEIATHESIHAVQASSDFTVKVWNEKKGRYVKSKDQTGYFDRLVEREAMEGGAKAKEELIKKYNDEAQRMQR